MSTKEIKFIGVKEFRQHMAEYAKKARSSNGRFVVMSRNKPLFEVRPFAEDEHLDDLVAKIARARRDVAEGRTYTQEEILQELG